MANDRTSKKPVLRERRVSLGPRSIITRGLDAAALQHVEGGLILSISGHDETSAQMVRARQIYPHNEIAWGQQYSDILGISPAGLTIVNYHLFHEIRPVGGALE